MKRRELTALLAAAPALPALAQGGPVEGRHYQTLLQPIAGTPGKIEVVEFFWYGCPHCYAFEPALDAWEKALPADVAFRKAHVAFRANIKQHQRMFFALQALGREEALRPAIFAAMHRDGLSLDTLKAQAAFLAPKGVDAAKYEQAFNSMGVIARCTQAEKLSEAYNIDGVPTLGIGGRYFTAPSMASGGQRLPEEELGRRALGVADFLINRIRNKA
jgi:protein dithiol oxidoreductase (disulfide-forming)